MTRVSAGRGWFASVKDGKIIKDIVTKPELHGGCIVNNPGERRAQRHEGPQDFKDVNEQDPLEQE